MAHEDFHRHFREDAAAVDWSRVAANQQRRLPMAEAWWRVAVAGLGAPPRRVADVGCGPGLLAHLYAGLAPEDGEVVALDLHEAALARVPTHPRLRTRLHDAEAAPLPEGPYDLAFVTDMLHDVRDPRAVLRDVRAASSALLVAEFDADAPADTGPPLKHRIAAPALLAMLRETGWAPGDVVRYPEMSHIAVFARGI